MPLVYCMFSTVLVGCNFYFVAVHVSVQLMPTDYSCQLASGERNDTGGFRAVIKLKCSTAEECDNWVAAFSTSSGCTWRIRCTYPGGRRGVTYRKDFVCQHSSFHKRHATLSQRVSKDTGCGATLSIKVCYVMLFKWIASH